MSPTLLSTTTNGVPGYPRTNKNKKRQNTTIMLDITRYAVKDALDNLPLDKQIWESIQD